jgi:hypothetical protein
MARHPAPARGPADGRLNCRGTDQERAAARGAYMMTATPSRQMRAPMRSHRSGGTRPQPCPRSANRERSTVTPGTVSGDHRSAGQQGACGGATACPYGGTVDNVVLPLGQPAYTVITLRRFVEVGAVVGERRVTGPKTSIDCAAEGACTSGQRCPAPATADVLRSGLPRVPDGMQGSDG